MTHSTVLDTTSSPCAAHRGPRPMRALLAAAAATTLLGLTACGDDSTVDNSQSEMTVPSVSGSAAPSESATASESAPAEASGESPAPAPNPNTPAPQDSGAEEVENVPTGPNRTPEDDKYLNQLRDKGVDLSKSEGASAPGGMEDQMIAAARGYCQSKQDGSPDVFTALAAGQLKAQGVVDREPQDIQPIIIDAAQSAYCG